MGVQMGAVQRGLGGRDAQPQGEGWGLARAVEDYMPCGGPCAETVVHLVHGGAFESQPCMGGGGAMR